MSQGTSQMPWHQFLSWTIFLAFSLSLFLAHLSAFYWILSFYFFISLLLWLRRASVVYFNQLLSATCTQKLVKLLFSVVFNLFCSFQTFFLRFCWFQPWNHWKSFEIKKKGWKRPALGWAQHPKAGRNPQQASKKFI